MTDPWLCVLIQNSREKTEQDTPTPKTWLSMTLHVTNSRRNTSNCFIDEFYVSGE